MVVVRLEDQAGYRISQRVKSAANEKCRWHHEIDYWGTTCRENVSDDNCNSKSSNVKEWTVAVIRKNLRLVRTNTRHEQSAQCP